MSLRAYAHSATFDVYKKTQEAIPVNLISAQYLTALDALLARGIGLLILHTNVVETYLLQIIGWQATHRRRKISFRRWEEFLPCAMYWLLLSKQQKAKFFPHLRIDRIVVSDILQSFLNASEHYEAAATGNLLSNYADPHSADSGYEGDSYLMPLDQQQYIVQQYEASCGAKGSLLGMLRDVRVWLACYERLHDAVLQKYVKHSILKAQHDYVKVFDQAVPLGDMTQVYIMAASRAINRCDPRQGVITTMVDFALLSARTTITPERRDVGLTTSLDSLPVDVEGETIDIPDPSPTSPEILGELEVSGYVQQLARMVDPSGVGRAYLGIQESPEYIRALTNSLPSLN